MDGKTVELKIDEIDLLKTEISPTNDLAMKKELAIAKYKMKMQSVQCTYGVLIRSELIFLQNVLFKLQHESHIKNFIQPYKKRVVEMFLVLYASKTVPHSWLWTYYTKLAALDECNDNINATLDVLFNDQNLNVELMNFITECSGNNYLLSEEEKEVDIYRELSLLSKSKPQLVIIPLTKSEGFSSWNEFQHYFNVKNMFLVDFKPECIIFEDLNGIQINWTVEKQKLVSLKNSCIENFNSRVWINNPFICNDYHNFVLYIVQGRLLLYSWIHLHNYYVLSTSISLITDTDLKQQLEKNLVELTSEYYATYVNALNFWNIDKTLFWKISLLISYDENRFIDDIYKAKKELLEIIDRGYINVGHQNVLQNLKNAFNYKHKEYNKIVSLLKSNIDALKNEISEMRQKFNHADIYLLNFFSKGDNESTFYTNPSIN
ncbi:uncharacterized protein LOC126899097 isoform X2 [Daktulosphaira vitifoliae]|nr:uncharacterized protein LOC126899097 isoform X2 [Daktulosphaira vitifoliae]XP_050529599.1 uncharacterized protein LOC126899097 isoform X2 [Daktulosphaira vitifoliae]